MAKRELPIKPEVVAWAIDESGLSLHEVAEAIGVDLDRVAKWRNGDARLGLSEAKKLAGVLKRQLAVLLLPAPPSDGSAASVTFRHPPGDQDRTLNAIERRYLRRARRLQQAVASVSVDLNDAQSELPRADMRAGGAEDVGAWFRDALNVRVEQQREWSSPSEAFDAWRRALEAMGVLVFVFPLGKDSCRGFSLWYPGAPVIAVNSAWNVAARTFTLFHECGHLVTRTDSACVETVVRAPIATSGEDRTERWCEEFAAAVLMPRSAVTAIAVQHGAADLEVVKRVARAFRTSVPAAALRLIELGLASWDLYREIPPAVDEKKAGGGGGGRDALEVREDQLGTRPLSLFRRAVAAEVMSRSEAVSYLDLPISDFEAA